MPDPDVVLVTVLVYKFLLLGIGLLAERLNRSEADFLLGGRDLGAVVAAVSASASSSSVWTLLGVSGYAYTHGLIAVWLIPACIGGFALNWYLIAPRLRAATAGAGGALTLTEFLTGPQRGAAFRVARSFAALVVLFSLTAYVASQFRGAGLSFEKWFDVSQTHAILIGAGIVVTYTLLGGFWAVSLTDTLQGLMMAGSALLLPVAALIAVGGPGALAAGIGAIEAPGFQSLGGSSPDALTAVLAVIALLGIGLGYPGQPHVVNRFMALRDAPTLARSRRVAMGWAIVVYPGMVLLGLCGRVLHETPIAGDNEAVFFQLTGELFPPVAAGILLAAVLSAIMSTADSQLLVASSAVSHDLAWKGRSARGDLLRSRLVVAVLSAIAVALALAIDQTIFASVLFAWSALGATFGPLLAWTLWRGPASARASLAAMVVGFTGTVLAYSQPDTQGTAAERVLPLLLGALVLWALRSEPAQSADGDRRTR